MGVPALQLSNGLNTFLNTFTNRNIDLVEFIGFPTNFRTKPEWLLATAAQRGTWLALSFYCATTENQGVITDCGAWPTQVWAAAAAVTKEEVADECQLFWEESDNGKVNVHVWGYDVSKEAQIQSQRLTHVDRSRKGGQATTDAKREAARLNGQQHKPKRTQANPSATQANPSEGKGLEEKRSEERGGEDPRTTEWLTPPTLAEAQDYASRISGLNVEGIILTRDMVIDWHLHRTSSDWTRGPEQIPIIDFKADLKRWCRNQRFRDASTAASSSPPDFTKKNGAPAPFVPEKHPLERVPTWDWEAVCIAIAPREGWGNVDLTLVNWNDLAPEHKTAIIAEHEKNQKRGAA